MNIVILTGFRSSSVFGGYTGAKAPGDYLYGDGGRARLEDADVIVAVWPPSDEPIIIRSPEGVTVRSFKTHLKRAEMHDGITPQDYVAKEFPDG